MIFSYSDIKWVKNVKRAKGTDWAFFENNTDQTFSLTFSDTQKPNAKAVKPGEIILLFQRIDNMPEVPKRTYLTHLVTPLDDYLIENKSATNQFKFSRNVAVIARAKDKINIYSTPTILNFYKPNWGKVCPIELLNSNKATEDLQKEIWGLFEGNFNYDIDDCIDQYNLNNEYIEDFELEVFEGNLKESLAKHQRRERNPLIVLKAKKAALLKSGKLICECCDFDFEKCYGKNLGSGFIECHHKIAISKGERITKMDDLALVCSNCHRMLHRSSNGSNLSVEELRNIIQGQL